MDDSLTGLPDRTALKRRLGQLVVAARRLGKPGALLVLDVNHFREVNQTFGLSHGDVLLRQIASRLRTVRRESDVVARVGDDEFAVILPDLDLAGAVRTVRKIESALKVPFNVEGTKLHVRATIGIVLYPQNGADPDVLLRHADVAMGIARRSNAPHALYDPKRDPRNPERLAMIGELREAIRREQLVLFYQPIVDVQTGTAGKVEALVRWQHPQRGLLSPGHFISLAEDTGLIEPLTIWVFRTALRQCATWHREGLDVRVAVNLSARSLHDSTLPDTAASVLHGAGIPPTAIEVEITEGTLMADPEQAMKLLARLHELGVRVSVDDFGTGYSSLAYLKTLPIDEVKIDRGFVTDMERSDNDAIIVRSVIDLGHNLGLSVTAEGVETRAAWEMLQARRCDLAQGFFLSRPLPGPDATSWLREPAHRTVEGRAACN